MKLLVLFAAVGILNYSCAPDSGKREAEGLAVAKKYMEAVETGNVAVMDSLLADNYVGYGPSVGDSIDKQGALANWKYNAEHLYESIHYTRHQNIAVTVKEGGDADPGDWVSNWACITIKYKDGRGPVSAWVNAVYKIEKGKIARSRTFYNEADVLRQLGYNIEPPAANP
jgi:ketosteroid isomerase-like protein